MLAEVEIDNTGDESGSTGGHRTLIKPNLILLHLETPADQMSRFHNAPMGYPHALSTRQAQAKIPQMGGHSHRRILAADGGCCPDGQPPLLHRRGHPVWLCASWDFEGHPLSILRTVRSGRHVASGVGGPVQAPIGLPAVPARSEDSLISRTSRCHERAPGFFAEARAAESSPATAASTSILATVSLQCVELMKQQPCQAASPRRKKITLRHAVAFERSISRGADRLRTYHFSRMVRPTTFTITGCDFCCNCVTSHKIRSA